MESEAGLCPANRHRPEQPSPQRFEAVAAFERDDRAAVTVRVPHRLPDGRGNRTGRAVQTAMADFTHRAPVVRRYRRAQGIVHTLPHFFANACMRYRRSGHADARAGMRGNGASPDSLPRAHRTVVFLLPLRIGTVSIAGGRVAAGAKHGGGEDRHRRRHDDLRNRAERYAAKPAAEWPRASIAVGTNERRRAQRAAGQASARSARRARRREG